MTMLRYATRMYNQPLLVTREYAHVIEQVIRAHEDGRALLPAAATTATPKRELFVAGMTRADGGYLRNAAGIALVDMIGTFVQRAGDEELDAFSGLVAYTRAAQRLQAAGNDPRVDAILMYVDSNGGEVSGIVDFVSTIDAVKKKKPLWGIADEKAFSAGMWVLAATDRAFVPQTGMVGSIGVRMLHVDQSIRDAKQGLVYTEIVAGEHKADFSPHAPLSEAAAEWAQDAVDRTYAMFVDAVASHRGIDPQVVRNTEARFLHPDEALALGLVDGIQNLDATLAALAAEVPKFRVYGSRSREQVSSHERAQSMDKATNTTAAGNVTADQLTEAQTRGFSEGKAEGMRIGTEAERARVAGILAHPEAADRRALAEHLAFKTDNTIEAAADLLKVAEKKPVAATNMLAANMDGVPNPKLADGSGAADSETGAADAVSATVARIMSAGKATKLSVAK